MLEIRNLSVDIKEKNIIKGMNLQLKAGELHVIMGPNGAGKSTLALALLGYPAMSVEGDILLNGKSIINLKTDERARLGMFLAFQNPQEVEGVSVANLLRKVRLNNGKNGKNTMERMLAIQKEIDGAIHIIGMQDGFARRDLNIGFSGGEKKRNEMLQMVVLKPKAVILDEIDSGLDIDALKQVAKAINSMRSKERCFMLITHYQRILDYIKPDFVHVMKDGAIIKSGDYRLAKEIEKKGYANLAVD